MSVIKNLRSLSAMEFYKNAITLRKYNSYHIIQNMDGVYYKLFNTS